MNITLALIQMTCSPSPEENLRKAVERVSEAAKRGAQVVCLQELFRTRYFCQEEDPVHFKEAEPVPGPTTELLSSLAKRHKVVLVGSLFEKDGNRRFNTAVLFERDGRLLGKYRKIHIPDDLKNYYGESFYFSPGDLGYPVFETTCGRIGLQVCYDQWSPEGARELAKGGAEIIFYPTAIGWEMNQPQSGVEGEAPSPPLPRRGGGGDVSPYDEYNAWVTVQRAHAISNGVFVAACNRVGREDHIDFWGTSFVCDPMGRILAQGGKDEEIVIAGCDLGRIKEVREDWPFLKEC